MPYMSKASKLPPKIPSTPLRIFTRDASVPMGPFFVLPEPLAEGEEMGDISDEEIQALAQIIFNAYLEWKQQ